MFFLVINCCNLLGLFRIPSILFSLVFNASMFNAIMPKTPRTMSTASSTISKPPVSDSITPVSTSISAPVIVSDSPLASSSGPGITSGPLCARSSATEPLSGGQTDSDLFRKFKLFMDWERSSHSPSGVLPSLSSATTVSVPSVRPVYTLAPSALSHPTNPPRSDLGSLRSSPTLASSRGQGAHVLPCREVSSRATRLPSSVARSGTVQSDNRGRSRASLSRGIFVERDALMASGDQSLADYYVDDLDFDHLGYSQFGGQQPSFDPALLDCAPDEFEPDNFFGSSPYSLSVQAETILCRYLEDLYCVNRKVESSEADSQSGGRSSARSDLFADASLAYDSYGINLLPVLAAEFLHLDSRPTLNTAPRGADSSFCFGEEDHSRFFSPQSLAPDTEAFGRSLKAPDANPLASKDYRLQDKSWRFVSEASAYAARLAAFSTALVDLLIRADELEVSEEDKASVHALLLDLSALNFSQAARMKLHATT